MGLAGESPQRGVVSSGWVCAGQCCIQSLVVGVGGAQQGPGVPQCWVPACRVGHRPSLGDEGTGCQGADRI